MVEKGYFRGFVLGRLAQLARAPALHAGSHRFESCIAHYHKLLRKNNLHGLFFFAKSKTVNFVAVFVVAVNRF